MRLCRAGAGESFSTTDSGSSKVRRNGEAAGQSQWSNTHAHLAFTYFRLAFWTSCRSEALYLVAQVLLEEDSSESATDALRSLPTCDLAEKTFAELEVAESDAPGQARPNRVDPKSQCSPLSQAKKNKTTHTKLQRVYYQLSLPALVQRSGERLRGKLVVVELQQTVRGFKSFGLASL